MTEFDKNKIAAKFKKSDNSTNSELCLNVRFLVASEEYDIRINNLNICYVIQFRISKELNSLI